MRKFTCLVMLLALICTASALQAQTSLLNPADFTSLAGYFNPGGNATVNMGANQMTVSGGSTYTGVVSGGTLVFTFDSVNVGSSITISFAGVASLGNKFALLSKGKMNIAGTINANADTSRPGPGGGAGAWAAQYVNVNGAGPGGGYGETSTDNGCSGGGAFGGNGGIGNAQPHQALAYGDLSTALQAGSGGGHGYYGDNGYAGGGGGAIELGARSATLTLQSTCRLYASGANGMTSVSSGWDGLGGGSGGGVLIHSYNVSIASGAIVNANGGAGGNGLTGGYGAGGAGGGRVSIYYHSSGTGSNAGTVTVTGGAGGTGDMNATAGAPGVFVFTGSTSTALGSGPPPSAPVANAASAITEHSFKANWDSVSGATKYYFDVATDSGFTSFVSGYNNLDVGLVDSCVVSGLGYSTIYYYRVRAYNAGGASGNSNTINVTTLDNQGPVIVIKTQPSSPQTTAGPYTVQAVITDPAKKGGKSIAADSLYYRINGGSWTGLGTVSVVADTFDFQIPAIDTGTVEYYLQAWDDVDSTTVEPSMSYYSFFVDTIPPYIVSTSPADGDSGVTLNTPVVIAFSEPMDTSSINGYPDPNHDFTLSWNSGRDTMTLTPDTLYDYSTAYSIIVIAGTDISGNSMASLPDTFITFTTLDNQGPMIVIKTQPSSPQNAAGPYLVQAVITDPAKKSAKGIAADSLYYRVNGGAWIGLDTVSVVADTFDFQIPAIDTGTVEYYLQAWDDIGATTVEPPLSYYSFIVDTIAPYIVSTYPVDGDSGVALDDSIIIVFSEPIDYNSFYWTSTPDPFFTETWNAGFDTVVLKLISGTYDYSTTYVLACTAATDLAGNPVAGLPYSFSFASIPSGVEGKPEGRIYSLQLQPAAPNPMTTGTTFRFSLPVTAQVSLEVFNVLGQKITTLVNGKLGAGSHTLNWNGRDDNGRKVSPGVFIYRLRAGGKVFTKKLIVVR